MAIIIGTIDKETLAKRLVASNRVFARFVREERERIERAHNAIQAVKLAKRLEEKKKFFNDKAKVMSGRFNSIRIAR